MAGVGFNRRQSREKEVKDLYAKITIGASGACTLTEGVGFKSITKNSTGDYTLVLADRYCSLKAFKAIHVATSAEDLKFQVKAFDVTIAAPYIEFLTLAVATPAHPASGDVILVKVEVKNTNIM